MIIILQNPTTSLESTFTSSERDKMNEEKHKAELEVAERKVERLKRAIVDADKQIFDLRHRAQRLAEFLGFSDINEAQRAFDMADHEVTFRHAFEQVQILEGVIKKVRMQNEGLQDRCHELEELLENERKRRSVLFYLNSFHLSYFQCNLGEG